MASCNDEQRQEVQVGVSSPHNIFWIPEGAVESVCAGCIVKLKQKFSGSLMLGESL